MTNKEYRGKSGMTPEEWFKKIGDEIQAELEADRTMREIERRKQDYDRARGVIHES